jgi:hypothetical protein
MTRNVKALELDSSRVSLFAALYYRVIGLKGVEVLDEEDFNPIEVLCSPDGWPDDIDDDGPVFTFEQDVRIPCGGREVKFKKGQMALGVNIDLLKWICDYMQCYTTGPHYYAIHHEPSSKNLSFSPIENEITEISKDLENEFESTPWILNYVLYSEEKKTVEVLRVINNRDGNFRVHLEYDGDWSTSLLTVDCASSLVERFGKRIILPPDLDRRVQKRATREALPELTDQDFEWQRRRAVLNVLRGASMTTKRSTDDEVRNLTYHLLRVFEKIARISPTPVNCISCNRKFTHRDNVRFADTEEFHYFQCAFMSQACDTRLEERDGIGGIKIFHRFSHRKISKKGGRHSLSCYDITPMIPTAGKSEGGAAGGAPPSAEHTDGEQDATEASRRLQFGDDQDDDSFPGVENDEEWDDQDQDDPEGDPSDPFRNIKHIREFRKWNAAHALGTYDESEIRRKIGDTTTNLPVLLATNKDDAKCCPGTDLCPRLVELYGRDNHLSATAERCELCHQVVCGAGCLTDKVCNRCVSLYVCGMGTHCGNLTENRAYPHPFFEEATKEGKPAQEDYQGRKLLVECRFCRNKCCSEGGCSFHLSAPGVEEAAQWEGRVCRDCVFRKITRGCECPNCHPLTSDCRTLWTTCPCCKAHTLAQPLKVTAPTTIEVKTCLRCNELFQGSCVRQKLSSTTKQAICNGPNCLGYANPVQGHFGCPFHPTVHVYSPTRKQRQVHQGTSESPEESKFIAVNFAFRISTPNDYRKMWGKHTKNHGCKWWFLEYQRNYRVKRGGDTQPLTKKVHSVRTLVYAIMRNCMESLTGKPKEWTYFITVEDMAFANKIVAKLEMFKELLPLFLKSVGKRSNAKLKHDNEGYLDEYNGGDLLAAINANATLAFADMKGKKPTMLMKLMCFAQRAMIDLLDRIISSIQEQDFDQRVKEMQMVEVINDLYLAMLSEEPHHPGRNNLFVSEEFLESLFDNKNMFRAPAQGEVLYCGVKQNEEKGTESVSEEETDEADVEPAPANLPTSIYVTEEASVDERARNTLLGTGIFLEMKSDSNPIDDKKSRSSDDSRKISETEGTEGKRKMGSEGDGKGRPDKRKRTSSREIENDNGGGPAMADKEPPDVSSPGKKDGKNGTGIDKESSDETESEDDDSNSDDEDDDSNSDDANFFDMTLSPEKKGGKNGTGIDKESSESKDDDADMNVKSTRTRKGTRTERGTKKVIAAYPLRLKVGDAKILAESVKEVWFRDEASLQPLNPGHETVKAYMNYGALLESDKQRLEKNRWFSDALVIAYINWMTRNVPDTSIEPYHIFNSYFMPRFMKDGYEAVQKWTEARGEVPAVNIFDKALLMVPICGADHWSLLVVVRPGGIDSRETRIIHLDSLGLHFTSGYQSQMIKYLQHEHDSKGGGFQTKFSSDTVKCVRYPGKSTP